MEFNYIVNPLTNKKIPISGRIGKKILKKYINLLIGGAYDYSLPDNFSLANQNKTMLSKPNIYSRFSLNEFGTPIFKSNIYKFL